MMSFARAACLFALLLSVGSAAHAGATEAERYRLQTELENLARKNAWTGVERTFKELEALQLELRLTDYMLGSQAAIQLGDLQAGLGRLQVGLANATPTDDPESEYAHAKEIATSITSRFGSVRLRVGPCIPVLILQPLPFAQDERDAFQRARDAVMSARSFNGMLPVGEYKLDTVTFTVEAGQAQKEIQACM